MRTMISGTRKDTGKMNGTKTDITEKAGAEKTERKNIENAEKGFLPSNKTGKESFFFADSI